MNIFYGSETGTAQDIAECLAFDFKQSDFDDDILISNLDSIVENLLSKSCPEQFENFTSYFKRLSENPWILIVSTSGQGDPPSNCKRFYKHLLQEN